MSGKIRNMGYFLFEPRFSRFDVVLFIAIMCSLGAVPLWGSFVLALLGGVVSTYLSARFG